MAAREPKGKQLELFQDLTTTEDFHYVAYLMKQRRLKQLEESLETFKPLMSIQPTYFEILEYIFLNTESQQGSLFI